MKRRPRRVPTKAELAVRLRMSLRHSLDRDQIRDLALAHNMNLDLLHSGQADQSVLWQWAGGILTWLRVAQLLGVRQAEMNAQCELADRVLQRYAGTGRVEFIANDYQEARAGVVVMDELAETVDPRTAWLAAEWSEALINRMADAGATHARLRAPAGANVITGDIA